MVVTVILQTGMLRVSLINNIIINEETSYVVCTRLKIRCEFSIEYCAVRISEYVQKCQWDN